MADRNATEMDPWILREPMDNWSKRRKRLRNSRTPTTPDTAAKMMAVPAVMSGSRQAPGIIRIERQGTDDELTFFRHHPHRHHQQDGNHLPLRRFVRFGGGTTSSHANLNSPQPQPSTSEKHDCKSLGCEVITINVSGQYFEGRLAVFDRHPETLLGDANKRREYYNKPRDEFFFDRHRPTFEAIFNYYQYGGRLRRPPSVPDDVFIAELQFFEIEKEVIEVYKKDEGYVEYKKEFPKNKFLKYLWMLFEYPETSKLALVTAIFSVAFTVISIILFCVETLPVFATSHCVEGEAPNFADPFFIIETMCTAWFSLEVIVRFIACPSKIRFFKDFKNIVDVTAIVPYYVTLFNVLATYSCEKAKSSASLAFLRVIRLVRIFKLTKHSSGLQVLILTFKASIEGLCLFLVALMVCILVFSSAIYYCEAGNPKSQIESIPDGFWWAVITMCTVGYGDRVPVGPWGKLIGSICALAGVLTLAIPVPIITENFNKFYTHKTGRGRYA